MGKTRDLLKKIRDTKGTFHEDISSLSHSVVFPSPWKRNAKKAKWLSGEALQLAEKRREAKSKGQKERYSHFNTEFQRIARRDKKAFLTISAKK